jgi:hypothetical protein
MLKKSITRPMCEYYNECKKTSNYLQKLYVGIVMDVKKPATIYKTYMWVLHIWNDLMEIIIERM